MAEGNGTNGDVKVTYSVKDLLARIDGKIDLMTSALNTKVDRVDFDKWVDRLDKLEDRVDNYKTKADANREYVQERTLSHRWRIPIIVSGTTSVIVVIVGIFFK